MGRSRRKKRKKMKGRRRPAKSVGPKKSSLLKSCLLLVKRSWKVVAVLGVLVGIAVGVKTLFWSDKTEKVIFEQPRFSEDVNQVEVSLGTMSVTYERSRLEKGAKEPFDLGGYKPVALYLEDGQFYADLIIYGGAGLPPIRIQKDVVYGKPSAWDLNYSKTALEIVTEQHKPVYQFIYKSPSRIVINGLFPFPGGVMVATEQGTNLNPIGGAMFSLNRIFKYPSWKYRGQYQDD